MEDNDPIPHKINFEPGYLLDDVNEDCEKYIEFYPSTH